MIDSLPYFFREGGEMPVGDVVVPDIPTMFLIYPVKSRPYKFTQGIIEVDDDGLGVALILHFHVSFDNHISNSMHQ